MQRRSPNRLVRGGLVLLAAVALVGPLSPPGAAAEAGRPPGTYTNPLRPRIPGDGRVESCADPTVIHGRQRGDRYWYRYCTSDPLNDEDGVPNAQGGFDYTFHRIPTMRSTDLVHWQYVGDAVAAPPSWAAPTTALWAPDVVYSRTYDRYYLLTTVTDTLASTCTSDSAIGLAIGPSPTGPWTWMDRPLVGPRKDPSSLDPCAYFWTFDPDVLGDAIGTSSYVYYGSYYGGMFGTRISLTSTGASVVGSPTRVAIGNRYEGANVIRHGGWYYLFGSATNCCNGPLTGYSVFVGRSRSPLGPFRDREGVSFLAGRVGGTPVLSMNGNRWVGPGHNTVFRDFGGQWWTIYHAVDRFDPYFAHAVGFTKRPPLLDALDWVGGWPTVRGGRWASDGPQPAPAAQPGQHTRYRPRLVRPQVPGRLLPRYSDSFSGTTLDPAWTWVRQPAAGTYAVRNGEFVFDTQDADLYVDSNTASVLTRPAPRGDYVVETKVRLNVPAEGCCHNYVQAGLVLYRSDDAFIKLAHVSIWETRQTEFAKEVPTVPAGYPRYGNTVVGPPGGATYLRIVVERLSGAARRAAGGDRERYTAYTSRDGRHWVRGGAWTHTLGAGQRIGLLSMGGAGFTARFDYVRVWTLRHGR